MQVVTLNVFCSLGSTMSGSPSRDVVTNDSDGLPSHRLMVNRLLGSSNSSATSPLRDQTLEGGFYLNSTVSSVDDSVKDDGVSGSAKIKRSSQTQYITLLEGENLELSEKALELERQLAESDRRCHQLKTKNKELVRRVDEEVGRQREYAQELTSSMLEVRQRTEQSAREEIKVLRRELELALTKKKELEEAFHVQSRTIAEISSENIEYQEKMKGTCSISKNEFEGLKANLDQSQMKIQELNDLLKVKEGEISDLQRDKEIFQHDAMEASNSFLSETKRYNSREVELNDSLQELRREMSVLAEREQALRSEAVRKEGALGAMSHDRLQAVQDLMLKEGECDKLLMQVNQYKADFMESKRVHENAQLEWKEKTKRWIETNQKAQETIESLRDLSEKEGKRANRLEIEIATLKSDLQYEKREVKRLKEDDSVAMKDLVFARQKIRQLNEQKDEEKRVSEKLELERDKLMKKVAQFDRRIADLGVSREQILGVVKFQSDALQRLSQDYETLSHSVQNMGGEIKSGHDIKFRIESDSAEMYEKSMQMQETLRQREAEVTNFKKQFADTERENIRLREENVEMKFVKERQVTLEADKLLVEELKTKLSVSESRAAELENSIKAMQVEYNHLRRLVKPQTETMEQMAVELKRALEREQAVRNELMACENRLGQLNSAPYNHAHLGQTPMVQPSLHWSSRSFIGGQR